MEASYYTERHFVDKTLVIISFPNLNISVFCCVFSVERQVFLATWKDIPNENELQYQIKDCHLNAGRQLCNNHLLLFPLVVLMPDVHIKNSIKDLIFFYVSPFFCPHADLWIPSFLFIYNGSLYFH